MSTTPVSTTIRFSASERDAIDQRAREHKMNRSQYMIRAALDDLPSTVPVDGRLGELEARIDRLEYAFEYAVLEGK